MKFQTTLSVMLLAGTSSYQAAAIQLDFSNLVGANISFDGASHFSFTPPPTANDFHITGSTGVGDSSGDNGYMSGTWTIGTVSSPAAGIFEASVTGTGMLFIDDGSGGTLTGSLTWDIIETAGTGGTLNFNGVLNLAGLVYTGSQQDLIDLATQGGGTAKEVVTFHTIVQTPGGSINLTLPDLKSGSTLNSSFAGTLTTVPTTRVPDGASSVTLLGFGMLAVEGLRRKLLKV